MRKYRRLTRKDRIAIEKGLEQGKSQTQMAEELGVHKSSISREIKRNKALHGPYRWRGAQAKANCMKRENLTRHKRKIEGPLEELVMAFLKKRLSPVQISGRLKLESAKWSISHETIYNWIYKVAPAFKSCLRWKSRRRQRRGVRRRRGLHKYPRRLIDQRPEAANQRLEPGHWERDLLEGQRGGPALLVLQDRFTRIVIIKKVNSKHCDHINQVTAEALRSHLVLSMTNDNGIEFGHYEQLEKLLKARVFYCHAYTSWERGSIENANGLLRQYFPKRTDFKKVDEQTLKRAQDELNHRPKKILGFRSPTEVHEGKKIRMIRSEKYYQSQLHQREQREFEEEMIREIGYYLKLTKDVYVALDP